MKKIKKKYYFSIITILSVYSTTYFASADFLPIWFQAGSFIVSILFLLVFAVITTDAFEKNI